MKKITLLLIFIHSISFSQIQYHSDSSFFFQKIYEIELPKQEIREKVNEWIAISFKNSNNVIKLNTEDKIILKGKLNNSDIDFDLITEFKDGRYKILLNNITKLEKPLDYQKYYKGGKMVSFEEFLIIAEDDLRSNSDLKERLIKKTLKNESIMKASYTSTEARYKDWYQDQETIKFKIPAIAKSLNSFIKSEIKSNDDW